MDANGNAVAVGRSDALRATFYQPGSGWGLPADVGPDVAGYRVAMGSTGAAVVSFTADGSARANVYGLDATWHGEVTLRAGCSSVCAGSAASGEAVVVLRCGDDLRLARSTTGTSFTVGAPLTAAGSYERCAFNDSGAALVAWYALGAELRVAYAAAASDFSPMLSVATGVTPPSVGDTYAVSLGASGDGHIVYTLIPATRVRAREYLAASLSLGGVEELESLPATKYYPSLAAAADGQAVVAWNQSGFGPAPQIWASRFY
jgi:hypothetical protein